MSDAGNQGLDIRFVGINYQDAQAPFGESRGNQRNKLTVNFRIIDGRSTYPLSIEIGEGAYDSDKLVTIARHRLHEFAQRLADSTRHWELPPDQLKSQSPKIDGQKNL